jgi:diguanylate cyclase (GGDEF)-like protein/PAS domain S-box-containing protein
MIHRGHYEHDEAKFRESRRACASLSKVGGQGLSIISPRSNWKVTSAIEWIFLLIALLALGGYIGYVQGKEYIRIETQERERLLSQAELIEKNLLSQLFLVKGAMDGILGDLHSHRLQKKIGIEQAKQRLKLVAKTLVGISVLIANTDGKVVASNQERLIGLDISKRDYFREALRQKSNKVHYATAPFINDSGDVFISLVRSITGPLGVFEGLIVVGIDTHSLGVLLDSLRYTPDARAFLATGDGKIFMMPKEADDLIGHDMQIHANLFLWHRDSGELSNVFTGPDLLPGDQWMIGFRTVQPATVLIDKPLVVGVSRDITAIFAPWYRESKFIAGMFGGSSVIAIVGLFFYQQRRRVFHRRAKKQAQALRSSEARLHSFFSATPDALLISDVQGTITMANQQVEKLLGYAVAELIGKSIEDLVPNRFKASHPVLRDEFSASPHARRMGNGLAVKACRKDGGECDVEVSLSRIETDEGVFFASALRDISERKMREEELLRNYSLLSTIFQNFPGGISLFDADLRLLAHNEQFKELLGFPDELFENPEPDFEGFIRYNAMRGEYGPGDPEKQVAAIVAEARKFVPHKNERARPDGTALAVRGVPLASGGFLTIYTDITDRKKAEEQLRIAAAAFESQACMIITDANSVIQRVNRAFIETTGYSAEEAVGQTPRLLQSGYHNASFYREMWETIHRTGAWQGEVWGRRKNGEIYPKWLSISAVIGANGTVSHYIGTHNDITERKKAEEKINVLAFFDQLTGLPNRTLLLDRLKQAMFSSGRSDNHGALLFIDLDNFKTLNDTLGHDVGDLLLKQVAQRLTHCVRDGDTVARLGGDEFVVVLANLSANDEEAAKDTQIVAEKILATLNQVYQLSHATHRSGASIGATLFKGSVVPIDDLMKRADLSMYKAKAAGRNVVRFFDPSMEIAVKVRAVMEGDLLRALQEKQFLLHYQAQMQGDRLTGAEVLLRWQHPLRGMVSPAEFISLAEETGLILPLGHWVLETACVKLAQWESWPEISHLTLAVNVSAHQFHQTDFVDQVLGVLEKTGANPQRLKLELTESLLVENVEDIIEKMSALKNCGVGFALDDFGTGYSSLSYLKRLPLDQLKIDQSFVRDVLTDSNDASIARTIVTLANSLGLGVIAEGVETEAQRDFLASSGCHAYQGYYFSRPLPIDDFEAFAAGAICSSCSEKYDPRSCGCKAFVALMQNLNPSENT